MSTGSRRYLLIVALLALINITGLIWIRHDLIQSRQTVDVLSATVSSSRALPDRLRVIFDQTMVPAEQLQQTEEAELFSISPALAGVWRWSGRDTAEFLPDQPFPPGQVLRLEPTSQITRSTGKFLKSKGTLVVETERLSLEKWTIRAVDENEGRIRFVFNQAVDPNAFLSCTRFNDMDGGAKLEQIRCLTDKPDEKIEIAIPYKPLQGYRITISCDLAGYGAQLGLTEPITIEGIMPEGFSLLQAVAENPDMDGCTAVRLEFTQELDLRQEPPSVTIEPSVENVQIERSWRRMILTGPFEPTKSYKITIPPTVLSKDGFTLKREISTTVEIPEYHPRLIIPHWSGILSPFGNLSLDARIVNIEGIELKAWRLHRNNLVPHLQGARVDRTSRELAGKKIDVNMPANKPQNLMLDLKELVAEKTGVYRITASATNQRWVEDYSIVTVTDLAITAKADRLGCMVWVTSLRTGQPVSGAQIEALTYNNQTLGKAQTDDRGIARLEFTGKHPDGGLWVITAEKGSDLSYLIPEDNQWVLDNMEQTGRRFCETYEAMLYTERGVYRPGDTVHLTGILRDRAGRVPSAFPLSIQVERPDGRQVENLTIQREDNDQGVFHTKFDLREDTQTGPYDFSVSIPGSSNHIGSTTALVEAFLPVRMDAQAHVESERFGPNTPPRIHVEARYLWDEPGAGLPVVVEGFLKPIVFEPLEYADYCFSGPDRPPVVSLDPTHAQLDPEGKTDVQIELPETFEPSMYRLMLSATVTEPGGRSVSRNLSTVVDRLDRYIGLKIPDGRVVQAQQAVPVDWVMVNGSAAAIDANEVKMSLARLTYQASMQQIDNRWIWKTTETAVPVVTDETIARETSHGRFEITCPEAGTYRLTLTEQDSGNRSCIQLSCVSDRNHTERMAMDRPESLSIVSDKDTYLAGQQATVVVNSPINGTMLLTAETDEVLQTYVLEVNNGSADVNIPITDRMRGSMFLTASVIRPVDPSAKTWQPHRAMGGLQVGIDHEAHRIAVQIDASREAKPEGKTRITVETGELTDPNSPRLVHLWAVDEGILLASAHKPPDPYTFFLGPRRPGVSTSDVFYRLLPDYLRPVGITRIGAGDFDLDELRRNPVPTRQRKAAVVWREAVTTDAQGQASFEFQWPDLIGQMRIMAVAVDDDCYGRCDQPVTLKAPLMIEAPWPRCVAPDDTFATPVKLFNSTEANLSVELTVDVNGPVAQENPDPSQIIELQSGVPSVRVLKWRATGTGQVEVRITGREKKDAGEAISAHHVGLFSVRPAAAVQSVVELKSVPVGEQLELAAPDSMIPGTARMTVSVGSRPAVQLGPALEKLIRYPYGCVEQTSSQLFSLLYASAVLDAGRSEMVDLRVNRGIARLQSMQTHSGGLSYWPGDPEPCLWGTAYAASCLLEAEIAGYEIDKTFMKDLMGYLKPKLSTIDGDAPDHNTKALICRVLATFGRPPYGWMARLAEQSEHLDIAGRAHLAGAYAAAGEPEKGLSLLPAQPSETPVSTTSAGRLTSQIRQDAVWLSVLLDIDPNAPMVVHLAAGLEKKRKEGEWGSTLNNASAVAALSKYQVRMTPQTPVEFQGSMQVEGQQAVAFDHNQPVTHTFKSLNKPVNVSSTGTGTLYITTATEGLAQKGTVKPYNQNLFVTRKWTNSRGEPIDPNTIRVGDLIQVEVTLRTIKETVHNIAVVDTLPGGLEIENPRLATSSLLEVQEPSDEADHVEFLDDRVVLFCSAFKRESRFRYSLRAVTAGTFDLAPIQASCMYDPAVASLGQDGRITVQNR